MPLRLLGVALLLGLAGCNNGDDQLERDARAACDAVQAGTMTIRQAEQTIGFVGVFLGCESNLEPIPGFPASACGEPQSVCHLRWQWLSSGTCGPGGGCAFVCDARVPDTAGGTPVSLDTVICARQFLRNQPYYNN